MSPEEMRLLYDFNAWANRRSLTAAAALTPDRGRDIATLMKNLRMAENVCAALGRARPAYFLYISSDGVYDARLSSLLNEESTCEPADLWERNLPSHLADRGIRLGYHNHAFEFATVDPGGKTLFDALLGSSG